MTISHDLGESVIIIITNRMIFLWKCQNDENISTYIRPWLLRIAKHTLGLLSSNVFYSIILYVVETMIHMGVRNKYSAKLGAQIYFCWIHLFFWLVEIPFQTISNRRAINTKTATPSWKGNNRKGLRICMAQE